MENIRLYLAGRLVDFSKSPDINFNYKLNDLSDPSVVKNSFSRTITVEGTDRNNDIFGHIYNLSRFQDYTEGIYGGSTFNPLEKTDFKLFINGEIYESGYFKLNEIRKKGALIEYDITLYGGLGDYFYSLSYKGDDSGNKLEIADLFTDKDLDFEINKDTVMDAWDTLGGGPGAQEKWETINFAPAYNGIPSDFEADKVFVKGITIPASSTGGTTSTAAGLIGTMAKEMTEWETKDLRSYLQRPVIRVKKILEACCDSNKNGGYEVVLDNHFFNSSNPYYEKTWMTLPMLRDIAANKKAIDDHITATIAKKNRNTWGITTSAPTFVGYTNANIKVRLYFTPASSQVDFDLFTNFNYSAQGGITFQTRFLKEFKSSNSLEVQMVGYNSVGEIVAYSNVINLCSDNSHGINSTFSAIGSHFPAPWDKGVDYFGKFHRESGSQTYTWHDNNGNPQDLLFTFNSDTPFTDLALRVYIPGAREYKYTATGGYSRYSYTDLSAIPLFSRQSYKSSVWQPLEVVDRLYRVDGVFGFYISDASLTYEEYDNYFSFQKIKASEMLTLGVTPCDFLLSYAKMFGLYFVKSPYEKKIEIMDRQSFYRTNEVINLNELIDRGKQMSIIPQVAENKWYDFRIGQADSEVNNEYTYQYGMDYGTQRLNTHFDFNNEISDIFKGNIFKSGIEVLEKDIYFYKAISGGSYENCQPYIFNGFTYSKNDSDVTITMAIPSEYKVPLNSGKEGFDVMSKIQFHTEDNEASDGEMVLTFLDGFKALNDTYYLSDDVKQMLDNSDSPCWLLTKDTTMVLPVTRIPHFSRNLVSAGYSIHSLDMGKPLLTYVPEMFNTDGMSIYDKFWKNYISDLYSVNSRKLTCYCLLENQPSTEWLRRFYWFDNSLWRLNSITDWNISSVNTTKMEFVKVLNLFDYQLLSTDTIPLIDIYFTDLECVKEYVEFADGIENKYKVYRVPPGGGTFTLNITTQDNGIVQLGSNMRNLPDWLSSTPAFRYRNYENTQYEINVSPNNYDSRTFDMEILSEGNGNKKRAHAIIAQDHLTELSIDGIYDTVDDCFVEEIPSASYESETLRYRLDIQSSSDFTYEIIDNPDGMLVDMEKNDSEIRFNVLDNYSGGGREARIRLSNNDGLTLDFVIPQQD